MSMPKQKTILTSEVENLSRIIFPFCYQIYFYKVSFSVQHNDNIRKRQVHIDCQIQFSEKKLNVKH